MPLIVDFIKSGQTSLISPALRTAGNFATGNDDLTSVWFFYYNIYIMLRL